MDCGGGGIKSSLFDRAGFQLGTAQRTAVRYPFSPADLLRIVTSHAQAFDGFERMTLGMPGMIRRGVVVYTPHYIRRAGPHTKVEPELAAAWDRLDMEEALAERFDVPALAASSSSRWARAWARPSSTTGGSPPTWRCPTRRRDGG